MQLEFFLYMFDMSHYCILEIGTGVNIYTYFFNIVRNFICIFIACLRFNLYVETSFYLCVKNFF